MFPALEEVLTHSCSSFANKNTNVVGLEHTEYEEQQSHIQENRNKTQSQINPRARLQQRTGIQKPFLSSLCPLVVTVRNQSCSAFLKSYFSALAHRGL